MRKALLAEQKKNEMKSRIKELDDGLAELPDPRVLHAESPLGLLHVEHSGGDEKHHEELHRQ